MTHNLHIPLAQTRAAEQREAAAARRRASGRPSGTPTVTELPRPLEPTTRDPFIDGLSGPGPGATGAGAFDPDQELAALVRAARSGDEAAWTRLVRRFEPTMRIIARSYRLSPADADDVIQATWLRLFKSLGSLREPAALPGWLTTTTRRECVRHLQSGVREEPTDDPGLGDGAHPDEALASLLAGERRSRLERALRTLPPRHRGLMLLLACDATTGYGRIASILGIPRGSIGPIRARCLERLAADPGLLALRGAVD